MKPDYSHHLFFIGFITALFGLAAKNDTHFGIGIGMIILIIIINILEIIELLSDKEVKAK